MAKFTKTQAMQSHLMETLAQNGFIDTDEALKPDNAQFIQRVLDKFCERIAQAQHEATWAMAMREAAEKAEETLEYDINVGAINGIYGSASASEIRAIHCPPLQTTNEESE